MTHLRPTDLKRLHRSWRQRTPHRLAVGLDDVMGPFNVGAVLRSAAAYRAEVMWITDAGTGAEHPKVGRTALGSERFIDVRRAAGPGELLAEARQEGFRVIAVELAEGAQPLHELDLATDVCLVIGNEDHGVHREVLADADAIGYLPQLGKVGSLNVATAASIAMYEWARQQWAAT